MAQDKIQLNTDGTGKKLDAWITASASQYRQVFIQGDPSTDGGVVSVLNSSLASIGPQMAASELSYLYGATSSNWQPINTDGSNNLKVNVANNVPVTVTVSTISVGNFPASQAVSGTVTANQGTNPWLVNASVIGNLPVTITSATLSVGNVINALASVQGTVPVSGTFFQATQPISGNTTVYQGTSPWAVNGTISPQGAYFPAAISLASLANGAYESFQLDQTGNLKVNVQGTPSVNQGTNPWVISGSVTTYGSAGSVTVTNVTLASFATVYQGNAPWTVTGSVGATQLGAPWTVNASIQGTPAVQVATSVTLAIGSMPAIAVTATNTTIFQGGAPWTVNASIIGVPGVTATVSPLGVYNSVLLSLVSLQTQQLQLDSAANLLTKIATVTNPIAVTESGSWGVTATIGNTPAVTQSGAPWTVNASIIGQIPVVATVATLVVGLNNVLATVVQGTNPWLVNASVVGQQNVTASIAGTPNVNNVPATSGGLSTFQNNLSATTVTLKSTAGQIYGYHIFNSNATQVYVNFYNASIATVGVTTPFVQLGIPASGGATFENDIGITFSAPIMVSACVSIGGTGTPGVSVSTNVFYN